MIIQLRHLRHLIQSLLLCTTCCVATVAWSGDFGNVGGTGNSESPEEEPEPTPDNCGTESNGGEGGNGGQSGRGNSAAGGDPINFYSGREKLRATDLVVKGVFPIKIQRSYDNHSTYDSPLGYGWSFNHDRQTYEYPDNSVIIRYGCGNRDKLVFSGGAYVPSSKGLEGNLEEQGDGSFIFTYLDGTRDYFNADGLLVVAEDISGNRLEYSYSTERKGLVGTSPFSVDPTKPMTVALTYQLEKIEERLADGTLSGNFVTFGYNSNTGRVTHVTASDGRVVTYTHDVLTDGQNDLTAGNLVTVTGLEGLVTSYKYEDLQDSHNLTFIQVGADTTPYINTYDAENRVIKQVYGNYTIDIDYTVPYTQTTVTETITDAEGNNPYTSVNVYHFNDDGYTTQIEDAEGYLIKHTLNGQNLVTRTEHWGVADAQGIRSLVKAVDYTYDSAGHRLTESVTLTGGEIVTTTWTYEGGWVASEETVSAAVSGKLFRTEYVFNYGVDGNPVNIKEEKRRKGDGSFQTVTYSYNARQQLISVNYPTGEKQKIDYANGSLYPTHTYWENSNGQPLTTQEVYFTYDARGNRTSITDAKRQVTTFIYDNKNRLIQTTNPLNEETHYIYTNDLLTQVETGRTYDQGNAVSGQIVKLEYDANKRLTTVKRVDDLDSDVVWQTITYDSKGQRLSVTDAENRTVKFGYDLLGRLVSVTDEKNNVTQYGYDAAGRQTSITNALSRQTIQVYDELDRLIRTEQHGISPAAVTQFAYDAVGNITSVTDPENNTTLYAFDTLSRKVSETRPMGQVTSYHHDNRNRLAHTIMRRGQKLVYSYETWGALKKIEHYVSESASTPVRTQSFDYDTNGNLTQAWDTDIQVGELYTVQFDALDRPAQTVVKYIPGGNRQLDYTYDAFDNRATLTLTDGASVTTHSYEFDALNRLKTALLANRNHMFGYNNADQLTSITYPNGLQAVYTYEDNGPVKSITLNDSVSSLIEALDYTYDAVLNVDTYSDADGLYDFEYDGLDRLTM